MISFALSGFLSILGGVAIGLGYAHHLKQTLLQATQTQHSVQQHAFQTARQSLLRFGATGLLLGALGHGLTPYTTPHPQWPNTAVALTGLALLGYLLAATTFLLFTSKRP